MDQKCCLIESEPLEMGEEDASQPMAPAAPRVPNPGGELPPACAASTRVQRARCVPAASLHESLVRAIPQQRRARLSGFYCHRAVCSTCAILFRLAGDKTAAIHLQRPHPRAVSRHGHGLS